ncbi:hypothetical protein H9Q69_000310 [Fusarium xylarioides]|nr:hypothetical protein H9Q69_000310 [Fusarium xylarioides]
MEASALSYLLLMEGLNAKGQGLAAESLNQIASPGTIGRLAKVTPARPGSVGYFDRNGNWKKILSLHDVQRNQAPAVQGTSKKFTHLQQDLTVQQDVRMDIETLTSSQTTSTDLGFKIDFPILSQTPINVGTNNAYQDSDTLGSVLVMKNPVVCSSIEDGDFLERWFHKNQKLFPKIRSAVKEHGVWLVTSTYTTEEIALSVWKDKDKVVKLGFSAGVEGIANFEPSIERGEKKRADGSFKYRAENGERLVSFVKGIRFHWRGYMWIMGHLDPGVAYFTDPRTYHYSEWIKVERVGIKPNEKHGKAEESGEESATKVLEAVNSEASDENAEPTTEETDEHTPSESSALSEDETKDDNMQDKSNGKHDLTSAVHDGHAARVQDALDRGSQGTSREEDYGDLLKHACAAGYEDITDMLIKAGADANALGGDPYTPLIAASENGHTQVVKLLLGAAADPDISNYCSNALFVASRSGHEDIVICLLKAGADVDQLVSGTSALQIAAEGGHDQCVKLLIAANADVDEQNEGTPLYRATSKGYLSIIQQLLLAGADVNSQEKRGDKLEEAPLHAAASSGRVGVVECLLGAGADVNGYGGVKKTPIAAAAISGCVPVVNLLLDELKASGKKKFGPALGYSVQQGNAEIVDMLLEAGASPNGDPEETLEYGSLNPPLIIAAEAGNESLVTRLIGSSANVNQYFGEYGACFTPLYAASAKGHLTIMRELLKAGAAVDDIGGYLGTPYIVAVSEGHLEAVTLLLEKGAGLHARDEVNDYPALVVALDNEHPDIADHLIKAGANVNDAAGDYGSALQAAAYKGYQAIAEMLIDNGADPTMEGGDYELPIIAAAARKHVDVVKMFIDRNIVTKQQAKKAVDWVSELIESEVESSNDETGSEDGSSSDEVKSGDDKSNDEAHSGYESSNEESEGRDDSSNDESESGEENGDEFREILEMLSRVME